MYFEKRKNKPIVIMLIAMMILSAVAPLMTDTAMAFSGKVGSVYTVWDAGRIEYGSGDGGYSNSKKCNLDDGLGTRYSYCVQPDKPSPTATRVTVDKVVTDDADTGKWNCLRNICYYSPSYPGYDNNVKKIVDNYYTGDSAKDFGIAHLAMSYVYKGRPDDLDTWNHTKASDLGAVWTKAKKLADALWKDGSTKDDAVPDNFKVFICKMEGVQDMVVGYMEAPGKLKMKKESSRTSITNDNDMYSLKGAEYTVYDADDKEKGTLTTDKNGNSDEIELSAGTYTVKETKAPTGYAKDTEEYTVKIESEELTTFTAKETPITGKIDILIEKDPEGYNYDHGEGDASLKGAVYKVEYFDDSTAPGEEVLKAAKGSGAVRTWYFVTNEKGEISGSDPKKSGDYTSDDLYKDADGNVVFPLGSYVITEVKAPIGYLLSGNSETMKVTEDGTDKKYTANIKTTHDSEVIIMGGVKLAKIDKVRNLNVPQGDATLEGAEFTVYNNSKNSVMIGKKEIGDGAVVMTISTDKNGIASTGKKDLPYGTYTVKETKASTGYLLNETWEKSFKVREDGTIIDLTDKPTDESIKLGGIKVYKLDKDLNRAEAQGDATLEGAEFTVYNKSVESVIVDGVEYKPEAAVMTITTGPDYTAETPQNLPYGTYLVKETKAPAGYLINDKWTSTVEVRKDKTTVGLTEDKVSETVERGGVKILKVDRVRNLNIPQGDATLEGAEFTITNKASAVVVVDGKEYKPGEDVMTIITDKNGTASTAKDALPFGTYSIRETNPSTGYLLNETWSETFTVRKNGEIVDLTSKPADEGIKLGAIKVFKLDKDLGRNEAQGDATLIGAEFTIYNKSKVSVIVDGVEYQPDAAITTISTGPDATAETPQNLPYGTYLVKETKAPTGYLLNSDWSKTVEVRKDKVTVELTDDKVNDAVQRGGVKISKIDSQLKEAYAQGDATLEGAEFTITNKSIGPVFVDGKEYKTGEAVKVISTDANGFAETAKDSLPYGTYSIKETKPSDGYLLNETWERIFEIRENGQMVDLTEDKVEELVKRSGIQIQKRDIELGKSEAMGGATLEGIVMTIRNVSDHDVVVRADIGSSDTVDWTDSAAMKDLFETEKVKRVIPNEDVGKITVHWNAEKNAYTAETLADDLPYGTYTIRESKTNDCYQRTDKAEHKFEVREDGTIYSYDDHVEILSFDDHVYRSDIQGTKIGDSTSERFSYVPFKIISVSTGETHVVVADKNGFFSTKDRRTTDMLEEDEDADNVRKINPFDDLMEAESITSKMIEDRKDEILMGNWFGTGEFGSKAEPDFKLGALPYDSYILEEMSCEKNEGYTLQRFFFTVDEKSLNGFVDLETITDDVPEIGTTASVNGKNTDVKTDKEITLIDTVEYTNLLRGKTYTVKGKLIDKATGEVVKDAAGNEITAETTFRPWLTHGKVKVKFIFDGSNMFDMDTVVFETVYDSNGHVIAKHDDINDEDQTVTWEKLEPGYEMYKVRTTKAPKKSDMFGFHALDEIEYEVHVENTGNIVLTTTVTDTFTENPEYFSVPTVKNVRFSDNGIWNNEGETDKANITINPGEKAVVTFTASVTDEAKEYLAKDAKDSDSKDKNEKDTNLVYQFNVTDDKDGYVNTAKCEDTTYPDPKNSDNPVPLEPQEDTSQTPVQKPEIGTTLTDTEGNKEVVTSEKTTLVDKIEYAGLDTSKWYVFEGTLIVKDTGDPLVENGKEGTVMSEPFKPSKANGTAEVTFEINTKDLEGKELVAFETAYRVNDYEEGMVLTKADKVVVAEHKDVNDEGQTIKLIKPDEPETPATPTPKRTDLPKTGDTTNLIIPALLLLGSAAGLTVVVKRRKRH